MTLKIGAIEKFSTIDYPNKIACIIFFKGCNFNCGFCYNKQLVLKELYEKELDIQEIYYFLDNRKGLIDAVVLSGGEPTIYGQELIDFIKEIKAKGYLVKLDTNGSNPEILKKVIAERLVDYIAMDLKDSFDNYAKYTKVPIENIKKSLELLKQSLIPCELRVTTHPELTFDSFNKMLESTKGQLVFVQDFVNKNTIKKYNLPTTIFRELSKEDKRYTLR
ncbi:MAG: anaerobic ribonucleoside-triphosphate reductase activating protein [archaeon]|jgi:pyruvate formate lyase activating enzyme